MALLVVAIVAVAAGMLALLLKSSAERLDEQQLATETVIVKSMVRRQIAKLASNVTDYALWDDMYDRFAEHPDPQWDIENLGPYGTATFQLQRVVVLGAGGVLAYDYDERGTKPMNGADLKALTALAMPMVAAARDGNSKPITGVIEFDGTPHFVAMHAIGVGSEKRKLGNEKPSFALVYLKAVDNAYLSAAGGDFNLRDLRTARDQGMVSLPSPVGLPPVFWLSWAPMQAGQQFIADSEQVLLMAAPIVAGLLVALGFGWLGMVNQARDNEMRTAQARADAAEETSRAKSLFIANMSHEFRTPLNAINGFSDFLKNDMLGLGMHDRYREYAGDIHASGQHLLRIVNNLLLFSKIEAKQHKATVQPLSLAEEVMTSSRMLQIVAEQSGVRLTCADIPKALTVIADQQALVQIIVNVIANAVKFSPKGGEVRVSYDVLAGERACALRVADDGCGIPKATLDELGQPFVQAEDVYTRRVQGTGLGLAICFKLAAQMGAKLTIASEEGRGTTVTLRLPLAEVEAGRENADAPVAPSAVAAA
jgi:signal transduction histidine kinase